LSRLSNSSKACGDEKADERYHVEIVSWSEFRAPSRLVEGEIAWRRKDASDFKMTSLDCMGRA
jgi:hypothetical protein